MITCTTRSVEPLVGAPGTLASRLQRRFGLRNINVIVKSGHCLSSSSANRDVFSPLYRPTAAIGTKRHVSSPRCAYTQGPSVWSQSDNLRQAFKSTPPSAGSKPGPLYVNQPQRPGTIAYYNAALDSLLDALRQGDTLKLYFCLMRFTRGYGSDESASWCFTEAVASIPPTTFSEILRCFDPFNVSKEIDTAPGIDISYGAAIQTPLGELVNKWGVKVLYVRILNRLHSMQDARRNARIRPLLNDYVVLMRCAGATSNNRAAKDVWYSMKSDGYSTLRHSEAFGEFVRARYLTEKLYANNDLARLRLRPLDLHRSTLLLPRVARLRLQHLQSNLTWVAKHRFGQNMHERYFAEPLTRILRKRGPLQRLECRARLLGMFPGDESLLCAFLKANGRSGRLEASNRLLKAYWGIIIRRDKDLGTIQVDGGLVHAPDSPMAPTEQLLDAIVHCYCPMGEITMAAKLVDFISRNFSIHVPSNVWSNLIEYARIMQTKPAANEWAIAQFHQKVAKADTVLDVWDICTQEPYNFQPKSKDYYNLIKSLIKKGGSMKKPIEALCQIKPLYDEVVRACEEAWCELLQTTAQGVPNHTAYRRYRELQASKHHIWYCFHYSSRQILNMIRPGRVDDHGGVRDIPNLVGEFMNFMPRVIEYHIATGYVQLASNDYPQRELVETRQVVVVPKPLHQYATKVQIRRDQKELVEDLRDSKDEAEEHSAALWEGMQAEMEAGHPEQIDPESTPLQAGDDLGLNLGQRSAVNMDSDTEERSLDGDQLPYSSSFGSRSVTLSIRRRALDTQLVEKPAYRHRPPYSGSYTGPSILSIRQDGGEFTGYHGDPIREHFVAHRMIMKTLRAAGVPLDLGLGAPARLRAAGQQKDRGDLEDIADMAEHLLWVST